MRGLGLLLIGLATTPVWGESLHGTVASPVVGALPAPLGYWRLANGHLPIAPPPTIRHALVLLEPAAPAPATPTRVTIEARALALQPRIVYGPVGSTFEIRNFDPDPRTLYLEEGENLLPREPILAGRSRELTPAKAGVYVLRDAQHPYARALLVVGTTPYATTSDEEGHFTLEAPAGPYRLHAFDGAWSATQPVEVGKTGEVTLLLPPPHTRGAQ